jgi:hypothetical protein
MSSVSMHWSGLISPDGVASVAICVFLEKNRMFAAPNFVSAFFLRLGIVGILHELLECEVNGPPLRLCCACEMQVLRVVVRG